MKSMRLSSIRTHAVSLPRRAVAPLRVRASSEPSAPVPGDSGNNNKTIALAGVGVGIALTVLSKVVGGGLGGGSVSIDTLVRESVPLETALKSGKPTIIEFYADWCEVCRESATNVYNVKQSVLNGKANLVMLNVENSAWAPEMLQFGVRAIPEYVFLDAQNKPQALLIGKVPEEILQADARALIDQTELPYAQLRREANETRQ